MRREAIGMSPIADGDNLVLWLNGTAATIVRVFQADQSRGDRVIGG